MERKQVIQIIFIAAGLLFVIRLFGLQVLNSRYKAMADDNAIERVIDYPHRGTIYDRNGKLLVFNKPVFDIMVVMRELKIADSLAFCEKFGLSLPVFRTLLTQIRSEVGYSQHKPIALFKQLSETDYAAIQPYLNEYAGLYTQARSVRTYPHQSAAQVLGYIGEISPKMLETRGQEYRQGDYIGLSGLELSYEKELRGRRGISFILKDVKGIRKGAYLGGQYDTAAVAGEDLYCGLDLELQQYGEQLMKNKIGSIVAIEPQTGEILSFVSFPSYDPNILSGRNYAQNYQLLEREPTRPLFNRPLMAMYPPGSIFKPAQALIALELGLIRETTMFPCDKTVVNCHPHPSPTDVKGSIQWSCNPYYHSVFRKIIEQGKSKNQFIDSEYGFDEWRKFILTMGFGKKLAVDLPYEKNGNIPSHQYYDRIYGDKGWKFSTIYSLSIGQGEVSVTPIQMANMAALMANRGWYITPHLAHGIGKEKKLREEYKTKHVIPISPKHFQLIVDGMEQVVLHGTAYFTKIKGVTICGKTGTAQNPSGEDHAVFIAFAPKENPKIAIAVFVENGGFGAVSAAPIANFMIAKYLKVPLTPMEKWMESTVFEKDLTARYKSIYVEKKR